MVREVLPLLHCCVYNITGRSTQSSTESLLLLSLTAAAACAAQTHTHGNILPLLWSEWIRDLLCAVYRLYP